MEILLFTLTQYVPGFALIIASELRIAEHVARDAT